MDLMLISDIYILESEYMSQAEEQILQQQQQPICQN